MWNLWLHSRRVNSNLWDRRLYDTYATYDECLSQIRVLEGPHTMLIPVWSEV